MPSLTLDVPFDSPLHTRILNGVRDRIEASKRAMTRRHAKWIKDEEAAIAYLPEKDIDASRRILRDVEGKPQYTTLQIPYSYAVLMSMHTYWTTVFLGRNPVFQFTGRHGESSQQVQAVEAVIDYQLNVGLMLVPLYIWLMDTGKYGLGVVGNYWEEEWAYISNIEEQDEMFLGMIPSGKKKKVKVTSRVRGYEGNKLFNIRPFDFFPDPRVPLMRFQEGEFCADYIEMGWNTILRRKDAGFYMNIEFLGRNAKTRSGTYVDSAREQGSAQLDMPEPTEYFFEPVKGSKKKAEVVPAYECCVDLIPKDWGIGSSNMPEKWFFTVDADYTVVLGAQPLGANHNKFPFALLQLEPEGYAMFGRGMPEILDPIQRTLDWLINSHFYNVRKTINNQVIIDPSRIRMKDVIDSAAGGIWQLRPSAYGQDVKTMWAQVQMVDVTQNHLRDMNVMLDFGQRAGGVSDQIMGMLNTASGRRTAAEVRTSSTFGINRLKTQAEFFSAQGWSPLSQMMVQNSQQNYEIEMKLKIVGDLAISAGAGFMKVAPENIVGFYDMVPVDGTLPVDRFAQANLWKELLAQFRAIPELMQRYDIGRMFEWVAQLAGLKNITQFKIQIAPDMALAQQAQAGNVVPLSSRGPSTSMGGVSPPRQLPGIGPVG